MSDKFEEMARNLLPCAMFDEHDSRKRAIRVVAAALTKVVAEEREACVKICAELWDDADAGIRFDDCQLASDAACSALESAEYLIKNRGKK